MSTFWLQNSRNVLCNDALAIQMKVQREQKNMVRAVDHRVPCCAFDFNFYYK